MYNLFYRQTAQYFHTPVYSRSSWNRNSTFQKIRLYDWVKKYVKTLNNVFILLLTTITILQNWSKFGLAEKDPPGPNPANTIVQVEEINMQIILNKDVSTSFTICSLVCRSNQIGSWSLSLGNGTFWWVYDW